MQRNKLVRSRQMHVAQFLPKDGDKGAAPGDGKVEQVRRRGDVAHCRCAAAESHVHGQL